MTENEQFLAQCWTWRPTEPVMVDGFPLSCPACGGTDHIIFLVRPEQSGVTAEHRCLDRNKGNDWTRGRLWAEPRITAETVRAQGDCLLDETNAIAEQAIADLQSKLGQK